MSITPSSSSSRRRRRPKSSGAAIPPKRGTRIRSVYEREIAQLEAKSGIRIDKQMRAVRVVELTDYAPLMPAGK